MKLTSYLPSPIYILTSLSSIPIPPSQIRTAPFKPSIPAQVDLHNSPHHHLPVVHILPIPIPIQVPVLIHDAVANPNIPGPGILQNLEDLHYMGLMWGHHRCREVGVGRRIDLPAGLALHIDLRAGVGHRTDRLMRSGGHIGVVKGERDRHIGCLLVGEGRRIGHQVGYLHTGFAMMVDLRID